MNDGDLDYNIEGRELLIDDTTVELKYVYNVTSANQIDATLGEAIAAYLAWDICYALTQSIELKDMCKADFRDALKRAKTPDAQEEPAPAVEADYYLDARLSSTSGPVPRRNWVGQ